MTTTDTPAEVNRAEVSLAAAYAAMQAGAPFVCAPPRMPLPSDIAAGHLAVVSSGSTGSPRYIVRTWASWQDSFAVIDERLTVRPGEVVGLAGPIWSTMILFAALHALDSDAIPLIGLDPRAPDTQGTVDVIHAVPTIAFDLIEAIELGHRSAPRLLVTAGATCPRALWDRTEAAGVPMVEYFGAAETSIIGWRSQPGAFDLVPGVEVDIRDGLIWVRSPYLAAGYLGADDGPLRRDGEWVSVADRGHLDVDGRLHVHGRGDEAVTTAGHTVVTADVEAVLLQVPGVEQLAVVGVPHERYGEILVAVYSGSVDTSVLRAAARALPSPARPRAWVQQDSLPRLGTGKLDRATIREVARS